MNHMAGSTEATVTASLTASDVESNPGGVIVSVQAAGSSIPLLELHDWFVSFYDKNLNTYIKPEWVGITGGMEAHGHGLPTEPSIQPDQDYRYRMTGMRFNMTGRWQLQISFSYAGVSHRANFELEFLNDDSSQPAESLQNHSGHDGHHKHSKAPQWSHSEIQLLKSLSLETGRLPVNTTGNAVASNPAAAHLGQKLFFDKRLSGNGSISCADCHDPSRYFTDGKPKGEGLAPLARNTLSIVGTTAHRWLYWDGRRDSLWSQALVPIEAENEMASGRVNAANHIATHYKTDYEKLFGQLPDLPTLESSKEPVGPLGSTTGRKLWNGLDKTTQRAINTTFSNIGKSLAAYQALLVPAPSRFDQYVAQISNDHKNSSTMSHEPALKPDEIAGLKLFISGKTQCLNCHASPMFTNFGFHNIGTGIATDGSFDFGRMMGSQAVLLNEFNCRSRYSDDAEQPCPELKHINKHEIPTAMRGAFRVPGLRGLSLSAPYMHDGRYATLEEVIKHYSEPPAYLLGQFHEMPRLDPLSDKEIALLKAFLLTLGDKIAVDDHWLHKPENH